MIIHNLNQLMVKLKILLLFLQNIIGNNIRDMLNILQLQICNYTHVFQKKNAIIISSFSSINYDWIKIIEILGFNFKTILQ